MLKNLRISTRLTLGFSFFLVLCIISTSFALISARSNAALIRDVMEKPLAKERLLSEWYVLTYSAIARTSLIARSTDGTLSTTFQDVIGQSVKQGAIVNGKVEALLIDEQERKLFHEILSVRSSYQAAKELVMNARKSGDAAAAERAYLDAFEPAANLYKEKLLGLLTRQRQQIDQSLVDIELTNSRITGYVAGLTLLLVISGVWVGYVISRSITIPLHKAVVCAKAIANGDLTGLIVVESTDETGQLSQALSEMNANLARTIGQVHLASSTIATVSGEIASGNAELSARTESQAGSLEQTAASMEELTNTVKQNADNAREANLLVISASDVASKGGTVVGSVVATMSEIKASSSKIVDIIGVINGIAFQTNILALNAAVEAARAGEQGRGFAVVASEVRNLAQRSAEAAKEIKTLIEHSVEKISHGSHLADQAGLTMDEIVVSVKHVADIMNEITIASREQNSGIVQINQAISQMDEMTQQNAALVEQAAAAAESMNDQAVVLVQAVGVFQLNGVDGRPHWQSDYGAVNLAVGRTVGRAVSRDPNQTLLHC